MAELVKVGKSEIQIAISRVLSEYADEVNEAQFECIHKAALYCKRQLKATSPGNGSYKNGWSIRVKRRSKEIVSTVYNRTDPQLTHLLEDSHLIKNQFGEYGRTAPGHGQYPHIKKAADEAEYYLVDLLAEAFE